MSELHQLPKTQTRYLHAISLQRTAHRISARRLEATRANLESLTDSIETLLDECLEADPYGHRSRPMHGAVMFVRECVFRNRDCLARDALVPVVETLVKATGRLRDLTAYYEFLPRVPKPHARSKPPRGEPLLIAMPEKLPPTVRTRIEEMAATFAAIIDRMAAEKHDVKEET